jgi:hypothetical protein
MTVNLLLLRTSRTDKNYDKIQERIHKIFTCVLVDRSTAEREGQQQSRFKPIWIYMGECGPTIYFFWGGRGLTNMVIFQSLCVLVDRSTAEREGQKHSRFKPIWIYMGECGPTISFFGGGGRGLTNMVIFQSLCQTHLYFVHELLHCSVCIDVLIFHVGKGPKFIFALFSEM